MKYFFIICTVYFAFYPATAVTKKIFIPIKNYGNTFNACTEFNTLHYAIRDVTTSKPEALRKIQLLLPQIKSFFYTSGGKNYHTSEWVFPVQGYTFKAIGGIKGNGYLPDKYDYFDGNKHKGHPAHDIFIKDKNRDELDDNSGQPVNILSMTGGIVVATETTWNENSDLRGGKYIWIYDPYSNSFYYYAHNSKILVKPCDIVKPGDAIAMMGRTGKNAYKQRSPTHLHIMKLAIDANYYPRPQDCYQYLTKAKPVKSSF